MLGLTQLPRPTRAFPGVATRDWCERDPQIGATTLPSWHVWWTSRICITCTSRSERDARRALASMQDPPSACRRSVFQSRVGSGSARRATPRPHRSTWITRWPLRSAQVSPLKCLGQEYLHHQLNVSAEEAHVVEELLDFALDPRPVFRFVLVRRHMHEHLHVAGKGVK